MKTVIFTSSLLFADHFEAVEAILLDERTNPNLIVMSEDGSYLTALDIAYRINGNELDSRLIRLFRRNDAMTFQVRPQNTSNEVGKHVITSMFLTCDAVSLLVSFSFFLTDIF